MDEKNIYFIADLHLFHKNIIQIENRPFNSLYDMHNVIIKNWNKKINKFIDKYSLEETYIENVSSKESVGNTPRRSFNCLLRF